MKKTERSKRISLQKEPLLINQKVCKFQSTNSQKLQHYLPGKQFCIFFYEFQTDRCIHLRGEREIERESPLSFKEAPVLTSKEDIKNEKVEETAGDPTWATSTDVKEDK